MTTSQIQRVKDALASSNSSLYAKVETTAENFVDVLRQPMDGCVHIFDAEHFVSASVATIIVSCCREGQWEEGDPTATLMVTLDIRNIADVDALRRTLDTLMTKWHETYAANAAVLGTFHDTVEHRAEMAANGVTVVPVESEEGRI